MPGYEAVKCRLIHPVGYRYTAWFQCQADWQHYHRHTDVPEEFWALSMAAIEARVQPQLTACPVCGGEIHCRGKAQNWVFDTEDGRNDHPGDMYFADRFHHDGKCRYWDGCTGDVAHLIVVCPNGEPWHIDGRASNCTLPSDRSHRCWVRHGEPPMITVDKSGPTCAAGAGSIIAGDYHGFLRDGWLTAG